MTSQKSLSNSVLIPQTRPKYQLFEKVLVKPHKRDWSKAHIMQIKKEKDKYLYYAEIIESVGVPTEQSECWVSSHRLRKYEDKEKRKVQPQPKPVLKPNSIPNRPFQAFSQMMKRVPFGWTSNPLPPPDTSWFTADLKQRLDPSSMINTSKMNSSVSSFSSRVEYQSRLISEVFREHSKPSVPHPAPPRRTYNRAVKTTVVSECPLTTQLTLQFIPKSPQSDGQQQQHVEYALSAFSFIENFPTWRRSAFFQLSHYLRRYNQQMKPTYLYASFIEKTVNNYDLRMTVKEYQRVVDKVCFAIRRQKYTFGELEEVIGSGELLNRGRVAGSQQ